MPVLTFAPLAAGVGSELLALQHEVARLRHGTHLSVTRHPFVLKMQSQSLHPLVLNIQSQLLHPLFLKI